MGGEAATVHDASMTITLHVNVRTTDLDAWKAAFAGYADVRRQAGVLATSVRHAVGDDKQLVVDLDFATAAEAESLRAFLVENVWKDQPLVVGQPEATILEALAI
jgi:hypothetical protein